ncbi:hypothetical protein [Tessaracoccus massiliensis]|uniref:hypothetical protein n=1 Tax=Tessaracoccus massiliensis TaxID=1522311 RepID=UPI00058FB219|nr:hypothetical protein [Tessaracoccus massiliensis]
MAARTLFNEIIRAHHIATPISAAISFQRADDALEAAQKLNELSFDLAPVIERGAPVGLFRTATARAGTVGKCMDELQVSMIVAASTPLTNVVHSLAECLFLFVIEGSAISGFITPTDLGSHAGRTHYYMLLADLEISLYKYLRERFPQQTDAIALLSDNRREEHAHLVTKLRRTDTFVDELSAVSLNDLLTIAGRDRALHELTGPSPFSWAAASRGLADFRNDVMHPSRDLQRGKDPRTFAGRLAKKERNITALIDATALARRNLKSRASC